jgi:hypothetical protein
MSYGLASKQAIRLAFGRRRGYATGMVARPPVSSRLNALARALRLIRPWA